MEMLDSLLSFTDIYYYENTPNILRWRNINIPCVCVFEENHIRINCKVFLSRDINDLITNNETYIKINDALFYIADYVIMGVEVGDAVIVNTTLVSKEPFRLINNGVLKQVYCNEGDLD